MSMGGSGKSKSIRDGHGPQYGALVASTQDLKPTSKLHVSIGDAIHAVGHNQSVRRRAHRFTDRRPDSPGDGGNHSVRRGEAARQYLGADREDRQRSLG